MKNVLYYFRPCMQPENHFKSIVIASFMITLHSFLSAENETVADLGRKADAGHTPSQYRLGVVFKKGEDLPLDYSLAVKWFRKAAEKNNADAQYELAMMQLSGQDDTRVSIKEAFKWLLAAANKGHVEAMYRLGFTYANDPNVETNEIEAAKWYELAAKQGHAKAQYELGQAYKKGKGVRRSNDRAAKYYLLAADQGHLDSQCELGKLYTYGDKI